MFIELQSNIQSNTFNQVNFAIFLSPPLYHQQDSYS